MRWPFLGASLNKKTKLDQVRQFSELVKTVNQRDAHLARFFFFGSVPPRSGYELI